MDLRAAVARLVAAEIAEDRRGFASRKRHPIILRELAEANAAMEDFYTVQPTNHPRAEEASPRFKATGLRILYASSSDHEGQRLVHVAMRAPAPFTSTLNVSIRVPLLPENAMFKWDEFVNMLQEPEGVLRDVPAIRSLIAENLREAGHLYTSTAILKGNDDDEIFW